MSHLFHHAQGTWPWTKIKQVRTLKKVHNGGPTTSNMRCDDWLPDSAQRYPSNLCQDRTLMTIWPCPLFPVVGELRATHVAVTSHQSLMMEAGKNPSVALVRERTVPTERPPLVGEVVPTLRIVLRGQRNGSPRSLVSVFLTGAATISSK
jgi:hypothetical protein